MIGKVRAFQLWTLRILARLKVQHYWGLRLPPYCCLLTTYLPNLLKNELTDWLTDSMQQNPSLVAKSSSASQKLPAFCWTRRFITEITSAHILGQNKPFRTLHAIYWKSILTLFSHLRFGRQSDLFFQGFLCRSLYEPQLYTIVPHALPNHASDLITRIILNVLNVSLYS